MTSWIPYGRHTLDDEDIAAVVQVLRGDWLTTGPVVEAFEQALARQTGARYAVVFSSGTAALHAAYHAAGIGPGDEVIMSPLTFAATANAAVLLGARPVFADVLWETGTLDPDDVARKLTPRTRAIVPVDYAGHPCHLAELQELAVETGAVLIEDACHALGASYRGRPIGSVADMTVFSFHPVKHITTGEGGAVVTDSARYREALIRFRNHGMVRDRDQCSSWEGPWYYEIDEVGVNYRITDFQCALGLSQLKKLEHFLARRRQLAAQYDAALEGFPMILPTVLPSVTSAWHLYVVRVESASTRRRLVEYLHARGIGVQVHYIPVHRHPYYRRNGYEGVRCPVAEEFYSRCLSLPLFPAMAHADLERVVAGLRDFFEESGSLRETL